MLLSINSIIIDAETEPGQLNNIVMKKPRLSFWEIWNMSFGFLGIQFGFALQNANVSRIFETLGASVEDIPILWIAAPVTGLIIQPIIGHLSDNTWNRLGRRRPYFLVGAILASLALIIMPNSPVLWVAAGMLWIMDASINISMEPFRAFVGDLLPSEQRTTGFAAQSFFIGIGAYVASSLPWMMTNWFNISNTAPEGQIPPSVKFSFYIGGFVFLAAVAWTVFTTKEYSPEEMEKFEKSEEEEGQNIDSTEDREVSASFLSGRQFIHAVVGVVIGAAITTAVIYYALEKELFILGGGSIVYGLLMLYAGLTQRDGVSKNATVSVFNDLILMPKTMKQLAWVQFFSWFALFAMWIYTTAGVTSHIYDMKLNAAQVDELDQAVVTLESTGTEYTNLTEVDEELEKYKTKFSSGQSQVVVSMKTVKFFLDEKKLSSLSLERSTLDRLKYIRSQYNEGADWVGFAFGIYNLFAAMVAFLLPVMAKALNRKWTHAISLFVGAIGLMSIYIIDNPNLILVSMVAIGLAWASILSMPYAILAGALPAKKMGIYMGIFNFFIVLPQILASTVLGFLTASLFDGQAIFALILGGITWILAAVLTLLVDDVDQKKEVVPL